VLPVEIVDALLARIERLNPLLNAYCTLTADTARHDARRAEAAVMRVTHSGNSTESRVHQDLTATRDIRTTRGSKLRETFVPE